MSTNKFLTIASNGLRRLATAISSSSGGSDANKIVATGGDGKLALSLMPNGVGPATITVLASENLAAGDFVNIWSNSGTANVRKADASNGRLAHGFTLSATTSGQNATIYQSGTNTALTGLTSGSIYFLSASGAGTATLTAPTASGHVVQELGFAQGAAALLYEYDGAVTIE